MSSSISSTIKTRAWNGQTGPTSIGVLVIRSKYTPGQPVEQINFVGRSATSAVWTINSSGRFESKCRFFPPDSKPKP